jgi:hypothetical protein
MLRNGDELFCLSCGTDLAEALRRTASLRCHECRDAGAPISFELAVRADELCRARAEQTFEDALSARRAAA